METGGGRSQRAGIGGANGRVWAGSVEPRPLSAQLAAGSAGKKGGGGRCGAVMGILWGGGHGDSMGTSWGLGTVG